MENNKIMNINLLITIVAVFFFGEPTVGASEVKPLKESADMNDSVENVMSYEDALMCLESFFSEKGIEGKARNSQKARKLLTVVVASFSDIISLNYKSKRIQHIARLISDSRLVSSRDKNMFLSLLSKARKEQAKENLLMNFTGIPPLVSVSEWDEKFVLPDSKKSADDLREEIASCAKSWDKYISSLDADNDETQLIRERAEALQKLDALLRVSPPQGRDECSLVCRYYVELILPRLRDSLEREIKLQQKRPESKLFMAIFPEPESDSYIGDYVFLQEMRWRAEEREKNPRIPLQE